MPSPYELIQSPKRKRLCIKIDSHDSFKVFAPSYLSKSACEAFIMQKQNWIQKTQEKMYQQEQRFPKKTFTENDTILYLGEAFKLNIQTKATHPSVHFSNDSIIVTHREPSPDTIKQTLKKWLKQQAIDILTDRVDIWSGHTQLTPLDLKFRFMKSRWGSCSSTKRLTLNNALIMAPLSIIDYVVIHELCHLKYMDHSKRFWSLVETFKPDYKACKKWLKEHQRCLEL